MATRRSQIIHTFDPGMDGLQPGKIRWEFNNTADILRVDIDYEEQSTWGGMLPATTKTLWFDESEALALLAALQEWRGND